LVQISGNSIGFFGIGDENLPQKGMKTSVARLTAATQHATNAPKINIAAHHMFIKHVRRLPAF
jgi:hypothetical protein